MKSKNKIEWSPEWTPNGGFNAQEIVPWIKKRERESEEKKIRKLDFLTKSPGFERECFDIREK